jgi:uncharacterized protein YkwD
MRRVLVGLATTAVVVALSASGAVGSAATKKEATGASRFARVTSLPQLETQVLAGINTLRRSQGLPALRASSALDAAAYEQSVSMAQHGFFGHESYGGSPFWKRVAARYARRGHSWSVGENLVWRSPELGAQAAIDLWLASPEHRANLLAPAWREIGLGAVHVQSAPGVYEGRTVTILTADFGVRH